MAANVKTRIKDGNMEFVAVDGTVLFTLNGDSELVIVGAGSALKLGQTASTTEGYVWYDLDNHVIKYRDNNGDQTVGTS